RFALRNEDLVISLANGLQTGYYVSLFGDLDIGSLAVENRQLGRHHNIGLRIGLKAVQVFLNLGVGKKLECAGVKATYLVFRATIRMRGRLLQGDAPCETSIGAQARPDCDRAGTDFLEAVRKVRPMATTIGAFVGDLIAKSLRHADEAHFDRDLFILQAA